MNILTWCLKHLHFDKVVSIVLLRVWPLQHSIDIKLPFEIQTTKNGVIELCRKFGFRLKVNLLLFGIWKKNWLSACSWLLFRTTKWRCRFFLVNVRQLWHSKYDKNETFNRIAIFYHHLYRCQCSLTTVLLAKSNLR